MVQLRLTSDDGELLCNIEVTDDSTIYGMKGAIVRKIGMRRTCQFLQRGETVLNNVCPLAYYGFTSRDSIKVGFDPKGIKLEK